MSDSTRRSFLRAVGMGSTALSLGGCSQAGKAPSKDPDRPMQGFEQAPTEPDASKGWKPVSDRKVRVGLAGYGVCKFGTAFDFQNHPNVEVIAVTDLSPDRCAAMAKVVNVEKTYPSVEVMVKDARIEAIFLATDAPSHARLAIEVMKHGKHVASAVPAVFGSLEDADKLLDTVKTTGMKYMLFETSYFHKDLYAARQLYRAGKLGKIIYAEGEYYHYMPKPIDSYKGWRIGKPPLWYPTHATGYFVGVCGGSFTEVSCMGMPSVLDYLQPANNTYKNPFGTEIALFRTSEGGMARMAVSCDTPGLLGEMGRIRGQKGTVYGEYQGLEDKKNLPDLKRPPIPPGVHLGAHGGSHGYLMNEFITAILQDRKPLIDVVEALNMTVAGIIAHQSAMKDGELLKIPQYKL